MKSLHYQVRCLDLILQAMGAKKVFKQRAQPDL